MDTERKRLIVEFALCHHGIGSQTIDHFDLWERIDEEVRQAEKMDFRHIEYLKGKIEKGGE